MSLMNSSSGDSLVKTVLSSNSSASSHLDGGSRDSADCCVSTTGRGRCLGTKEHWIGRDSGIESERTISRSAGGAVDMLDAVTTGVHLTTRSK
jgi:hypothetical protein